MLIFNSTVIEINCYMEHYRNPTERSNTILDDIKTNLVIKTVKVMKTSYLFNPLKHRLGFEI